MAEQRPPTPPLPPQELRNEIQESWPFIEHALDDFMKLPGKALTVDKRMDLTTLIYQCSAKAKLGGRPRENGAKIPGELLHRRLVQYLRYHGAEVRKRIASAVADELPITYAEEWQFFKTGVEKLGQVFRYLDKYFVSWQKEAFENPNILSSVDTAMRVWREEIVGQIGPLVIDAALDLIKSRRNGKQVDLNPLRALVDSLLMIERDGNELLYKQMLEEPFLLTTESFYADGSTSFLEENDIVSYMQYAENRRTEEQRLLRLCMSERSLPLLQKSCRKVLVQPYTQHMWDVFERLLRSEQREDLRRMYCLLADVPADLIPLHENLGTSIINAVSADLNRILEGLRDKEGKVGKITPEQFIETIVKWHKLYTSLVVQQFANQHGFVASLDQAFEKVMTTNPVTKDSSYTSAQLLVEHMDILLKKSVKLSEETRLHEHLKRAMTLFKFIEDKDLFQTLYAKKLCRRLLSASISDDNERSMVSVLKEACGLEYVRNFEQLFKDIKLSVEISEEFNATPQQQARTDNIKFSVSVMPASHWPMQENRTNYDVPPQLLSIYNDFTAFYLQKHPHHLLQWEWTYARFELRPKFLRAQCILSVDGYQTAILLLYNDNDNLLLSDIVAATLIPAPQAGRALDVLVKAKVLLSAEPGVFDLNPNFKSKKHRVNLTGYSGPDPLEEAAAAMGSTAEERKYATQATLVRVMKGKKAGGVPLWAHHLLDKPVPQIMKLQALIAEATRQMSEKFKPQPLDIKRAIDGLLEKEFIERVEGERDTFHYVA